MLLERSLMRFKVRSISLISKFIRLNGSMLTEELCRSLEIAALLIGAPTANNSNPPPWTNLAVEQSLRLPLEALTWKDWKTSLGGSKTLGFWTLQ